MIRGPAAWALRKIGSTGVKEALLAANQREQDEEVLAEIEKGLKFLTL